MLVYSGKEYEFHMSKELKVKNISEKLEKLFPGCHFYLNNQLLELDNDDKLDDVMDDGDMLTATKHDPSGLRATGTNIQSDSDSIITLINKRDKKPIILKPHTTNFLNVSSLAYKRIITVFR